MITQPHRIVLPPSFSGEVNLYPAPITSSEHRYIGLRLIIEKKPDSSLSLCDALNAISPLISSMEGVVLVVPKGFILDSAVYGWNSPRNAILATSAALIQQEAIQAVLKALHRNKHVRLAVDGRAENPLPADMVNMFEYSLIRDFEDRRRNVGSTNNAPYRRIPFITQEDIKQSSVDAAIFCGAVAVIGWRFQIPEGPLQEATTPPGQAASLRLFKMINAQAPIGDIETALSLAPAVLTRLLTIIRIATGGEVHAENFAEALDIFGYHGLVKFMTIHLLTSGRDFKTVASIYAALFRGALENRLEGLSGKSENDGYNLPFVGGALSVADAVTLISFGKIAEKIMLAPEITSTVASPSEATSKRRTLCDALDDSDAYRTFRLTGELGLTSIFVNQAIIESLQEAESLLLNLQPD
jgi:hypothetical protein